MNFDKIISGLSGKIKFFADGVTGRLGNISTGVDDDDVVNFKQLKDYVAANSSSLDLAGKTIFPNKGSIGGIQKVTIAQNLTKKLIADLSITTSVAEIVPLNTGVFIQVPLVGVPVLGVLAADTVIIGWSLHVLNTSPTRSLAIKDNGGNDSTLTIPAMTSGTIFVSTTGIFLDSAGLITQIQ